MFLGVKKYLEFNTQQSEFGTLYKLCKFVHLHNPYFILQGILF